MFNRSLRLVVEDAKEDVEFKRQLCIIHQKDVYLCLSKQAPSSLLKASCETNLR